MIQHAAAAALLLAQATPQPAEPACITPEQAGDLAVAMLPYMVDAAVRHCRPHVASDSFIATGAQAWSERLRRDGEPRRASALRGVTVVGAPQPPGNVDPAAAFDLVAQMLSLGLTAAIRPESCGQVDTIARSLEPLPTDNIASLVGATLTLAMSHANIEDDDADADADSEDSEAAAGDGAQPQGERRRSGPPICPA